MHVAWPSYDNFNPKTVFTHSNAHHANNIHTTMCLSQSKRQHSPRNHKIYNQHDLTAPRNEWLITPPAPVTAYLKRIIKEERDLPIAYLFLNVVCTVSYTHLTLPTN